MALLSSSVIALVWVNTCGVQLQMHHVSQERTDVWDERWKIIGRDEEKGH